MSDEGFREIQLSGKQLVFLFMTATVVAVVIFLCGVMVGRGVPTPASEAAFAAQSGDPTEEKGDGGNTSLDAPTTLAAPAAGGASAAGNEGLTYPGKLEAPDPVAEPIERTPSPEPFQRAVATVPKPAPAPPAAKPPVSRADAPRATAPSQQTLVPGAGGGEPAGNGFVVQVSAVKQRQEAEAIRARLTRKGYPAFVTTSGAAGAMFRVRVGKYDSKREADAVAAKLQKEEQFKPWVTR